MTRAGIPVAAMAEHIAYLRWLMLILRCQRRQVLVGANMRPPRHMLPNAPCPERWVPPPRTRGILATARPVPHDSADVWWPADKITKLFQKFYFLFKILTPLNLHFIYCTAHHIGYSFRLATRVLLYASSHSL